MTETKLKRNDTSPPLTWQLLDALGNPVNLTGAALRFLMREVKSREVKVDSAVTVTDAAARTGGH